MKSTIEISGRTYDFPMIIGTEEEIAINISSLRSQTNGIVTIDPAYVNTAACESEITFLDGEKGILRHRGYAIDELAEQSNFLEVAYLLIFGELPKKNELENFIDNINKYSATESYIKKMISCFPNNMHPMAMLSACMVSLSAAKEAPKNDHLEMVYHSIAQIKNIGAYCYRHLNDLANIDSNPSQDYCSDFITMLFGNMDPEKTQEFAKAFDVIFMLHADHEQNCSTSSVRLVGSSKTNLYAALSAGVDALWGPLHGGANQAVIKMLEDIHKNGYTYKEILKKAKDKNNPYKLMGFGHRVYKNFDPRSKIIKKMCDKIISNNGHDDPLLSIASGLEEEALSDPYFIERKLYPNVDFYSGLILRSLNIPTYMFTVIFAIGRLPGWLAQWREMIESPASKIGRPRQIYQGYPSRKFVALEQRS
jgi:citrate synthase